MAPDSGSVLPLRRCVVCRRATGKDGLFRVVRGPDGRAVADPAGRLPGRGAYVCRQPGCLSAAQVAVQVARGLRLGPGKTVGEEVLTWLSERAETLPLDFSKVGAGR